MSEGRRKYPEMNLTEFKEALGSPAGCDPMPVEHHEFPMRHPKLISRAVVEFMSVIYSKTIRRGHRSPVAVHAGGNKLFTLRDVQEDRKWSEDWTQRVFRQACDLGLVRAGKGARNDYPPAAIVLQGRVKPIELQQDTTTKEFVGPEGALRFRLSSGEYQQYEKLPEDLRGKFLEEALREFEVDDRIEADALRLARHYNTERRIERLTRYGITPDPLPARRYLENPVVELKLLPEELEVVAVDTPPDVRSVPSEDAGSDQDTYAGADTPVYTGFSSAVSLCGFPEVSSPEVKLEDPCADKPRSDDYVGAIHTSSSSLRSDNAPPPNADNSHAAKATVRPKPAIQRARQDEGNLRDQCEWLAQKCNFDTDAARQIIVAMRREDKTIKLQVIRDLIIEKATQLQTAFRQGKIENFVGLLIRSMPKAVHSPARKDAEKRAARQEADEAHQHREDIATAIRVLEHRDSADPSDVKWAVQMLRDNNIEYGATAPLKTQTAGGD